MLKPVFVRKRARASVSVMQQLHEKEITYILRLSDIRGAALGKQMVRTFRLVSLQWIDESTMMSNQLHFTAFRL